MDKRKSKELKDDGSNFTKSENKQNVKACGRDRWVRGYSKTIKNEE